VAESIDSAGIGQFRGADSVRQAPTELIQLDRGMKPVMSVGSPGGIEGIGPEGVGQLGEVGKGIAGRDHCAVPLGESGTIGWS
jgi:hypothetical protein